MRYLVTALAAVVAPCVLAGCQIGNARTAAALPVPPLAGANDDATVAPDPSKLPVLEIAASDWASWSQGNDTQTVCDLRKGTVNQARVDLFVKHMTAAKLNMAPDQVKLDAFPMPSTSIASASMSCDAKAPVFGLDGVGIKPDVILWTGHGMDFDGPQNTDALFDVFAASLDSGVVMHAHFDLHRNPADNTVSITTVDDIAVGNVKAYLPATTASYLMVSAWAGELYFVEPAPPTKGLYTGVRFNGKNMLVARFVVQ